VNWESLLLREMMGSPRYPADSQTASIAWHCEPGLFLENSAYHGNKSERFKGSSSLIDLTQTNDWGFFIQQGVIPVAIPSSQSLFTDSQSFWIVHRESHENFADPVIVVTIVFRSIYFRSSFLIRMQRMRSDLLAHHQSSHLPTSLRNEFESEEALNTGGQWP
jgi:hypothetical protein